MDNCSLISVVACLDRDQAEGRHYPFALGQYLSDYFLSADGAQDAGILPAVICATVNDAALVRIAVPEFKLHKLKDEIKK